MGYLQLIKQKIKPLILFVLFFLILFVSEATYNIRNHTPRLVFFYLELSKDYPHFLKNAIKVRIRKNLDTYPDMELNNINYDLGQEVLDLYKIDPRIYKENELPLVLYNLGIESYKKGHINTSSDVLQKAILVDPELSYTYVELANIYQITGENDKVQKTLNECFKYKYPKLHCAEFLENNILKNEVLEPGFLTDTINSYYFNLKR